MARRAQPITSCRCSVASMPIDGEQGVGSLTVQRWSSGKAAIFSSPPHWERARRRRATVAKRAAKSARKGGRVRWGTQGGRKGTGCPLDACAGKHSRLSTISAARWRRRTKPRVGSAPHLTQHLRPWGFGIHTSRYGTANRLKLRCRNPPGRHARACPADPCRTAASVLTDQCVGPKWVAGTSPAMAVNVCFQ
jgi:hypothetical protein